MLQETIVIKPDDQDELDVKQLEEEHTMIIRASDPNAPSNVHDYNFAEQLFKPRPTDPKNQVAVHFDRSYRSAPFQSKAAGLCPTVETTSLSALEPRTRDRNAHMRVTWP